MNRLGLTKLEKLAIAVAVLAVIAVLIPLYRQLVDLKYTADCLSNLKDIATAINLYQLDYQNTLPVAYYANPDGSPQRDSQGYPLTWVLCVSSYLRKDIQRTLRCPADPLRGSTVISHPREPGKTLQLSYGFYAPLSARRAEDLLNPGLTIMIADSVAGGQLGTLNPRPLLEGNDGFLLGYDDSLLQPTPESRYITRLAVWRLRESEGWEDGNLRAFHGKGVNVLHADGHVSTRSPAILLLEREPDGRLKPPWSLPQKREDAPPSF
ncbi:MAG: H-X9-DG-CTERM domain-containing protein [Fimbriimonadales bacterium]